MTNKAAFWLLWLMFSVGCADAAEPGQRVNDPSELAQGSIVGVVKYRGEVPKSSIPDEAGLRRNLLQVDKETRGLANVVVWLTAEDSRLARRTSAVPPTPVLMDQLDHEFVPRVIAVAAGQPVKFSNSDPANHNVRTSSAQSTNEFNVFTAGGSVYTHSFAADVGHRPVRVGCDIHPWMRGWIYVFEHPWFAVTDEKGRFRISSVPAGKYTLAVRQPDIRFARDEAVTISNREPAKLQLEIKAEDVKSKE